MRAPVVKINVCELHSQWKFFGFTLSSVANNIKHFFYDLVLLRFIIFIHFWVKLIYEFRHSLSWNPSQNFVHSIFIKSSRREIIQKYSFVCYTPSIIQRSSENHFLFSSSYISTCFGFALKSYLKFNFKVISSHYLDTFGLYTLWSSEKFSFNSILPSSPPNLMETNQTRTQSLLTPTKYRKKTLHNCVHNVD